MIYPHTELRFVSNEIGYGIFATRKIPKGTITWVQDELDREFTQAEVDLLPSIHFENLMKYTYKNKRGNYLFCWDLTRYVNHSFMPNTILTALGVEVAIKDIEVGDEITNDYGTFNLIEAFKCAIGSNEGRTHVYPNDLVTFQKRWDEWIESALPLSAGIEQPLNIYFSNSQKEQLQKIANGEIKIPSIIENYFQSH